MSSTKSGSSVNSPAHDFYIKTVQQHVYVRVSSIYFSIPYMTEYRLTFESSAGFPVERCSRCKLNLILRGLYFEKKC